MRGSWYADVKGPRTRSRKPDHPKGVGQIAKLSTFRISLWTPLRQESLSCGVPEVPGAAQRNTIYFANQMPAVFPTPKKASLLFQTQGQPPVAICGSRSARSCFEQRLARRRERVLLDEP